MNAVSPSLFPPGLALIPDSAPFTPAQRAWLNGFFAGLYGEAAGGAATVAAPMPEEDFPWHDPALELPERLALAEGKPLARRLMAAMAQLDCGQCGYLCQSYSEAIASGAEPSLSLCVPGAKPTARTLKQMMAEAPAAAAPIAVARALVATQPVRVVSAERLTAAGSAKDVRHVVIDLSGTGLQYQPGDSLSLAAPADPALVAACLAALRASGEEMIALPDGTTLTARAALSTRLDIARPLDRTCDVLAMHAKDPDQAAALRRLVDGEDAAEPDGADLLDLLEIFRSSRPGLQDLLQSLPALKPRLYSIASARQAVGEQVHLCVSVVRTERRQRLRHGIASAFLGDRAVAHGAVQASIQTSHFRLPRDPATPVIMCGPGTGIAPFRAFLQQRAASGEKPGRSWLFFGDQHAATDFLYRSELEAWLASGVLGRLDTAFSRDQPAKIYVQDRMAEHAADLWRWLQDGGHFYVCGDASRMARDVDATLRRIAISEGQLSEDQARDWMVALARQGRYQRDVY